MKRVICFATILVLFTSCRQYKYLPKNTTVYKIKSEETITEYKTTERTKVKIEDKGHYLVIKDFPGDISGQDVSITKPLVSFPAEMERSAYFFFPGGGYESTALKNLVYDDGKIFIQGLSIPIKIRPALDVDKTRYLDTFSRQVETGINLGLSAGYKFSRNWFSSNKNYAGQNTNRVSFAPAVFLTLGAADLKKVTTNYKINVERKAPVFTYGGAVVIGFNNINIGYGFGFDHIMDDLKKDWVYQGKLWHGILFGIDVVK